MCSGAVMALGMWPQCVCSREAHCSFILMYKDPRNLPQCICSREAHCSFILMYKDPRNLPQCICSREAHCSLILLHKDPKNVPQCVCYREVPFNSYASRVNTTGVDISYTLLS